MKKHLIFYLLHFICIFGIAQNIKNYESAIGKRFLKKINTVNVFKEYKIEMGVMISGLENENKGYDIISNVYDKKVILSKAKMQGNKVQYFEILSILDIGKIKINEQIIVQECRLNKKKDNLIIALINPINSEPYYTKIIKAWKLNPKNNTFNPIPTKGIDCLNEEFDN